MFHAPMNNQGRNADNPIQILPPLEMSTAITSLNCNIDSFGLRSKTAWYFQFPNQYSRFTPLLDGHTRYIWRLMDEGRMLVIDSFINQSREVKILSNPPSCNRIDVKYFEQTNETDGFIVYSLENHLYLSTTKLDINRKLLEVNLEKARDLWDLAEYSYSVASVDYSNANRIGFVLLGRQTFETSRGFFFTLTDDDTIKILLRQPYTFPSPPLPTTLPLFHENNENGDFMMVKHCNGTRWSNFQRVENEFRRREERRRLGTDHRGVATRFTSSWLNLDENIFIGKIPVEDENQLLFNLCNPRPEPKTRPILKMYNHRTKTFREVKLPERILSQMNESLYLSIFVQNDVMLICGEEKSGKALNVTRVMLRSPDTFTNLTTIFYRQSKYFNESNTYKLKNCLIPQKYHQIEETPLKINEESKLPQKRLSPLDVDDENTSKKPKN